VTDPRLTHWRRTVASLAPGLGWTALIAVLCNLVLEAVQLTGVREHIWDNKTSAFPLLFLLGTLVIWLLVGLVHAVFGRLWVTAALAGTVTATLAIANYEKVHLRREPVYPSDWEFLRSLGFLQDMIGVRFLLILVAGLLVAGGVVAGVAHLLRKRRSRRQTSPLRRGTRIGLRVVTGVVCLLCLGYLTQFNAPGNSVRRTYEALGADWTPWSQQRNYLGNSFVAGFLYNLDVPAVPEPPGYGAATMARIVARYTAAAERINRDRDPDALDDVNVVAVLSESFSDPTELRGVEVDEDPIPFTRRLMDSTTSGRMLTANVGGGTANMEFEALTGMSLSLFPPQLTTPYQMLVPDYDAFPSAVSWFRDNGHRAVAMHPFSTEMYRRREVYGTFGFDEFVYDREMRHTHRIGRRAYISDNAAFNEVLHQLRSQREPLYLHLVTMQNHIPYPGRYVDPVTATGPDGEQMNEIGHYARGLAHSDRALEHLVGQLERSRERTVVVYYGDHLPGAYPGSVFQANTQRTLHQTPFLVWANFPGPVEEQPTTSPTHVMDLVLERAGAAVPPYYALLDRLRHEIPAMDAGMLVDDTDRLLRADQLSGRAAQLLRDYRLVQYDLSVGERYSEDPMFGVVPERSK
jgi:phosphoglycerol transferase MdoB-like AlkP superfamily enzyme